MRGVKSGLHRRNERVIFGMLLLLPAGSTCVGLGARSYGCWAALDARSFGSKDQEIVSSTRQAAPTRNTEIASWKLIGTLLLRSTIVLLEELQATNPLSTKIWKVTS